MHSPVPGRVLIPALLLLLALAFWLALALGPVSLSLGDSLRALLRLAGLPLAGARAVRPAQEIDPHYAAALREALAAGVEVLAYGAELSPQEIRLTRRLEVLL